MTEVKEKLPIFNVSVSFYVPMEGMVPIAAKSKEDAIAITTKMFEKRKDLQIVDVYDLDEVDGLDMEDLDLIKSNTLN